MRVEKRMQTKWEGKFSTGEMFKRQQGRWNTEGSFEGTRSLGPRRIKALCGLALPLPSSWCDLGTLISISEPQFPHLSKGKDPTYTARLL